MNKEKENQESKDQCNINSVIPRFSVSLVYESYDSKALKVLILNASCKHSALGEAIEYFESETKGFALILKTVIELNGA
tara:strand:- start:1754 stop:1990 length:237 start_codon:yes stop_codon:yes gene_type:complete